MSFLDEMNDYLSALKNLVEDTYTKNNEQPVVLMGHSMGNNYILYLLNRQPQSWKDKYIRSFISIAGPYGGAVKTLRLMASGTNCYSRLAWSAEYLEIQQQSGVSTDRSF